MSICRVCAKKSNFCFSIDQEFEEIAVSVVIQVVLPIQIRDDDEKPKAICYECFSIVTAAYKLRQTSLQTDELFKVSAVNKLKRSNTPQTGEDGVLKRKKLDSTSSASSSRGGVIINLENGDQSEPEAIAKETNHVDKFMKAFIPSTTQSSSPGAMNAAANKVQQRKLVPETVKWDGHTYVKIAEDSTTKKYVCVKNIVMVRNRSYRILTNFANFNS